METSPPNIFLIVIDTLRKDHVGIYGYERATTPFIDGLGRAGLVFDNAVAQSSWTLPSVMSFLTSKYPARALQAPGGTLPRLEEDAATLTEALQEAGYRTLSATTNPYNSDAFNLMQGFEVRVWKVSAPASWVVDNVVEELRQLRSIDLRTKTGEDAPVFVYLHFMDAHVPRTAPPPYDTMFPVPDGRPHGHEHSHFSRYTDGEDTSSDGFLAYRSHTIALYDGCIRFIDAELARLWDRLAEFDLLENSVFVVTSDHGEEFWDHVTVARRLGLPAYHDASAFGVDHGHTLFPELIEVPLIFHGPGVPRARIEQQVRLLDLAPTVLELAGVAPMQHAEGFGLLEWIHRGHLEDLPALSQTWTRWAEQKSLRLPPYQYLRIGGNAILFDPAGEIVDVAGAKPRKASKLANQLDRILEESAPLKTRSLTLEPKLLEQLQALGYMK